MSNTWITYPREGDNSAKAGLIPYTSLRLRPIGERGFIVSPMDGSAAHQLVGKVMAYQGYDG